MGLIPVAEALDRILAGVASLPGEHVPTGEAQGRVLCEDLAALRTQPPAPVSAMDGYAVRAADLPGTLAVIGEASAGAAFEGSVNAGEAVRIFTGAVVPAGADAVVIQEATTREGARVTIAEPIAAGRNIRVQGLDFTAGSLLLPRGRRLTARDIGLAAAANHALVPVHRRPRVAFISTGDELVLPGETPGPAQIVASNQITLAALLAAEQVDVLDLGIVPDQLDATERAIAAAREWPADVLVTAGGASVGERDLVQSALTRAGMDLSFWKVALRPGKPLIHGRLGPMAVLGVPGNPVSAYVCALLFLVPLVRQLSGRSDVTLPIEPAVLGCDLPGNDQRADYMRARLAKDARGGWIATPFPVQDSSMLRTLAEADALLVRAPHAPPATAGDRCDVIRLPA